MADHTAKSSSCLVFLSPLDLRERAADTWLSKWDGLPSARMALRTAKDKHFTDEDWLMLVEIIKNKK